MKNIVEIDNDITHIARTMFSHLVSSVQIFEYILSLKCIKITLSNFNQLKFDSWNKNYAFNFRQNFSQPPVINEFRN